MIRINLLPRRRRQRLVPELGVSSVIVLVIAALVASYAYGKLQNRIVRAQTQVINHQIEELRPKAGEILDLEARIEHLRAKETLIKSLEARQLPWPELLTDLAERTPADAWLGSATLITSPEPQLSIDGKAFSYTSVAHFMTHLASSPYYSDVDLGSAVETNMSGKRVIQFSLVVTLRPTPIAAQGDPR